MRGSGIGPSLMLFGTVATIIITAVATVMAFIAANLGDKALRRGLANNTCFWQGWRRRVKCFGLAIAHESGPPGFWHATNASAGASPRDSLYERRAVPTPTFSVAAILLWFSQIRI